MGVQWYTQGSRLITYERRAGTHMSESEGVAPVELMGVDTLLSADVDAVLGDTGRG